MATLLQHGAFVTESQFNITQHFYMGGELGFMELLEITDKARNCQRFVIHEQGEDERGELHRFAEWNTLEDTKRNWGIYSFRQDLSLTPGFLRFINLGHDIPWFYAGPGDIASLHRALKIKTDH
jgi:hypothetical protein